MRLDARTKAADALREWSNALNVPFLGVLREAQQCVKGLDSGMTLFDLSGNAHAADLLQWDPILEWLAPLMKVPHASRAAVAEPTPIAPTPPDAQRVNATRATCLMPAQEGLVHGNLYAFTRAGLRSPTDTPLRPTPTAQGAGTPQFLLRQ
jgi:chromosome partitioning protein